MMMKNKLYKHHKRKAFFVIRQFSFAVIGIGAIGLGIGIPTYISSIQESQISAKAEASSEENKASEFAHKKMLCSELLKY